MKRLILEMGTGNDLYGQDYTKAGRRAVQDAIHHSSLTLFRSLGLSHEDMNVKVTIAVQQPDKVDKDIIAAELPRGNAYVTVVFGGLDVHDARSGLILALHDRPVPAQAQKRSQQRKPEAA